MYMFTRIAVNVPQVYLPLYLTSSLSLKKESIAYYPLMMLICSVIGSFLTRPLSKYLGKKGTYVIGAVLIMGSSFWFQFQVTRSCIVYTMYIVYIQCTLYIYTYCNNLFSFFKLTKFSTLEKKNNSISTSRTLAHKTKLILPVFSRKRTRVRHTEQLH